MINNKITVMIHKYGIYYVSIMMILFLYEKGIHPNTRIYWGFVINFCFGLYIMYVKGAAFGILKTYELLTREEKEKDDIKNN